MADLSNMADGEIVALTSFTLIYLSSIWASQITLPEFKQNLTSYKILYLHINCWGNWSNCSWDPYYFKSSIFWIFYWKHLVITLKSSTVAEEGTYWDFSLVSYICTTESFCLYNLGFWQWLTYICCKLYIRDETWTATLWWV